MSGEYLYRAAGPVTLYLGDAAKVLATLPDSTVNCVVTSPPYWGHRDYGVGAWHDGREGCPRHRTSSRDGATCPACGAVYLDPQYGLEPTLDGYIDHLVAVFAQARRVLTADGTCWVNLGDSYATAAGGAPRSGRRHPGGRGPARPKAQHSLAAKNLVGVPWRVALALQADGWRPGNCVA